MFGGKIKQADNNSIIEAANLLKSGQVIVFPTETVYGIGANIHDYEAIERIYTIKSRPKTMPLQILCENLRQAKKFGIFNGLAEKLAKNFWPGPITIVVPINEKANLKSPIASTSNAVGIRIPADPTTLKLIRTLKSPIASTSANFSGGESSVNAVEAAGALGSLVPFIIDGGACTISIASTVVDATGDKIKVLREGALSEEELNEALKKKS